jgi:hypothetical protein
MVQDGMTREKGVRAGKSFTRLSSLQVLNTPINVSLQRESTIELCHAMSADARLDERSEMNRRVSNSECIP